VKLANLFTVGALTASLVSPVSMAAQTAPAMPEAQKKQVEQVIHDYLLSNPELLIEVSQALQKKQQENMQQQAQSAIKDNTKDLLDGKIAVAGNPNGKVTIIEFFDYQCIHCKKMSPIISKLIKNDSNIRVVYKEFPIFGKSSELASRAALAAGMQGKYMAMHEALIGSESRLNDKIIMKTAESLGLNMKQFKEDMNSKKVDEMLAANRELAEKLHLMGTPAFIVAATPNGQFKEGTEPSFIPGAASEESLQEMIKKASQA